MISIFQILILIHVIGLILAVGSATIKLLILVKSNFDLSYIPVFLKIARPVTKLIITGTAIITLSGIGFFFVGYPFTTLLVVKIILVSIVWILGPYIDNAIEPKFVKSAPSIGNNVSQQFIKIKIKYLTFEIISTSIFYVCIVIGVLL